MTGPLRHSSASQNDWGRVAIPRRELVSLSPTNTSARQDRASGSGLCPRSQPHGAAPRGRCGNGPSAPFLGSGRGVPGTLWRGAPTRTRHQS